MEGKTEGSRLLPALPLPGNSDFTEGKGSQLHACQLTDGQLLAKEESAPYTLFILLESKLQCVPFDIQNTAQVISARCLFLIPTGESFFARAESNTTLLLCTFERHHLHLPHLLPVPSISQTDSTDKIPYCLSLNRLLAEEADTALHALLASRADAPYFQYKASILLHIVTHAYTPKETATLFAPLLSGDPSFRESVLRNYSDTMRVKELSEQLRIPPTTFNRKFRETFHTSAKEWFTRRRREGILHDILYTSLSITEVSDKYNLTPNYLMKFCKDSFGMTFTELRQSLPKK